MIPGLSRCTRTSPGPGGPANRILERFWEARIMDVVSLVILLVVVGVILWLVNWVPYIHPTIKQLITVVVVVVLCLWLLSLAFNFGNLIRIER